MGSVPFRLSIKKQKRFCNQIGHFAFLILVIENSKMHSLPPFAIKISIVLLFHFFSISFPISFYAFCPMEIADISRILSFNHWIVGVCMFVDLLSAVNEWVSKITLFCIKYDVTWSQRATKALTCEFRKAFDTCSIVVQIVNLFVCIQGLVLDEGLSLDNDFLNRLLVYMYSLYELRWPWITTFAMWCIHELFSMQFSYPYSTIHRPI